MRRMRRRWQGFWERGERPVSFLDIKRKTDDIEPGHSHTRIRHTGIGKRTCCSGTAKRTPLGCIVCEQYHFSFGRMNIHARLMLVKAEDVKPFQACRRFSNP